MSIDIRSLNDYLPESILIYDNEYFAAYNIRHVYREADRHVVRRVLIGYGEASPNKIISIIEQLLEDMYDHGNGD